MQINTNKNELFLNKCTKYIDIAKWIEQDIIVPDTKPDAMKIINVSAFPYISDFEVMENKIKVTGKINYYIIYGVDDEKYNTRGLFVTHPYEEILDIKDVNKDYNIIIKPFTKNIIYSLPNERKISVKTEILFKVKIKNKEKISLITDFDCEDSIECKRNNLTFKNIIQDKKSIIASHDDVMLPKEAEDLFEILRIDTSISNTELKESYNKIMVKGDLNLKILYTANNESENIKKTNVSVPFSAMIEFSNINDNSKFDIEYLLKDFNFRLNEDITTNKTINVDYQIEANTTLYEDMDVEYIEDFYSQTRMLNYDSMSVDVVTKDVDYNKDFEIKDKLVNILPENTKLLDYYIDTTSIVPRQNQNMVTLEGNAKVVLLLQDISTGVLSGKTIDILVNETFEIDNYTDNMKANVEIKDATVTITQSGSDLDVKLILDVNTHIENVSLFDIIKDIVDEKLDISTLDSINIYVVKPGDNLWKIAKKYKTSVEKIVKTNNIENPDVINVGEKILIIR